MNNNQKQEKKKNLLQRVWDKIGNKGRFAVAAVCYLGFTVMPFPTTPFTMFFAGVMIVNSETMKKMIVKYRKKYPEKAKKIIDKFSKIKKMPQMFKDIIRDTDPEFYLKKKLAKKNLKTIMKNFIYNFKQEKSKEKTPLEKAQNNRNLYRRMKQNLIAVQRAIKTSTR